MKNISLTAAFAVVIVANAFALIHVARNRSGTPDSELSLTKRELEYTGHTLGDEDSGVTMYLRWVTRSENLFPFTTTAPQWLDRSKLRTLGFDCRVNPDADGSIRFYQRQRPRRAFVAFEYNGAAWQTLSDAYEDEVAQRQQPGIRRDYRNPSHLVAIDADLDARSLRNRYADRSRVMIAPAVIAIALNLFPGAGSRPASAKPPRVEGRIEQLPSEIHLSRPLSDLFQGDTPRQNEIVTSSYTVRLRYGKLLEPWVEDVKFGQ